MRRAIEAGLHATAHDHCVGRDGTEQTRRAKVVSVHRIENLALWKQYWHRKSEITDMHLAHNVTVQPLKPPVRSKASRTTEWPSPSPLRSCSGLPWSQPLHSPHRSTSLKSQPQADVFTIGNHTKQRPIATQRSGESALDPDGLLEPKLNECFLYHGTKSEVAELVATHGFGKRPALWMGSSAPVFTLQISRASRPNTLQMRMACARSLSAGSLWATRTMLKAPCNRLAGRRSTRRLRLKGAHVRQRRGQYRWPPSAPRVHRLRS